MPTWECSKGLEPQSTRDVQGLGIACLDNPQKNLVPPLLEGDLKHPPKEGLGDAVGECCDVEGAAGVLVVVVPGGGYDLTVDLAGDAAEVIYPNEARAPRNPSVNIAVPEQEHGSVADAAKL